MTFMELIIATVMAIGVGLIFYYGFKTSGPWSSFWAFIAILILAGIIGEAWLTPIGPIFYGSSWLGTLIFILFFAFLIAATTPPRTPREALRSEVARDDLRDEPPGVIALGIFFWFLIILMGVAAIWGWFYTPVF